ncbi:MAG: dihydropteroate synthase [Saprospiraceae bacterium]
MSHFSLNCKGRLLSLHQPVVMGILNVTPDSFYDGGRFDQSGQAQADQAARLLEEGAAIIDIGGASSKPNAKTVSLQEELDRVIPVVEVLAKAHPDAFFSIDTYRSAVAKAAIEAGVHIINDISSGQLDDQMFKTVAELKVPYIGMHMQGTPDTMQDAPIYEDVVQEVYSGLAQTAYELQALGLVDIVIDPGFGFGKTVEHNYEMLARLSEFRFLNRPILVGLSRKSMIYRPLGITPAAALNGTTALHMAALERGANILRVHDVKEAVEARDLYVAIEAQNPKPLSPVPIP